MLLLLSILLLKCRSAIVGTAVSLLIITATRCWSIAQKVTKPRLILFSVLFIIASLLAGMYIYNAKKKSSDGRLLIWKLSTELINARPQGYGYGLFEKYYNQQQSSYFLDNKRPADEIMLADHVSMAYNDFIEQCVEGGIIGGMLYLLFFLHTIRLAYKKKDVIAMASLVAILLMSMLNFIYTAPQCWIFTMCIAAKVFSENKDMNLITKHKDNASLVYLLYIVISVISTALLYENIRHTKAQVELTKLYSELSKGDKHNQEYKYLKLSKQIGTSELFYTTWAKYYIKRKYYDLAVTNLIIANKYTSNPNVYFLMSECYARSGNTTYAINCLRFLSGMLPHHFYPEIYLLRAYDHIGKTDEAMEIAQHIISKPVKISSNQTFNIKNEACQYIREHE
ncbi:MAG: O-antigen ligase family protein [Prevotella sp.]|nr:O-antigen ligase family protein [Prevotella sp.]